MFQVGDKVRFNPACKDKLAKIDVYYNPGDLINGVIKKVAHGHYSELDAYVRFSGIEITVVIPQAYLLPAIIKRKRHPLTKIFR